MKKTFLSVIVPAYQEEKRISGTLLAAAEYLAVAPYSSEIIVVNDGSEDATADVVRELQKTSAKLANLRLIDNSTNHGKGHAVRAGMLKAQGELRLFMDADNSVKISELERFFPEIERGFDVVIGSIAGAVNTPRSGRVNEGNGLYRELFRKFSELLTRLVATPGIYDTQRGFKLFTRRAAEIIFPRQTIERFGFDIEILVIAQTHGLQIKELPVAFDNPAGSTVKISSYFTTFGELAKIVWKKLAGSYKFTKEKNIKEKSGLSRLFLEKF